MKKRDLRCSPCCFAAVLGAAGLLILAYLARAVLSLLAVASYQQFEAQTVQRSIDTLTPTELAAAQTAISNAIRFDTRQAHYLATFGSLLTQSAAAIADATERADGFAHAERLLKQAARSDPARPWYFYDLGRFALARQGCRDVRDDTTCPTASYFAAALTAAPTNAFLRNAVSLWFYGQDRAAAFQVMRAAIARYQADARQALYELAQLLYELKLDYESDQQLAAWSNLTTASVAPSTCQPLTARDDAATAEFGRDNGTHEWRSVLFREEMRLKKTICVPANLDTYATAALKILLARVGSPEFRVFISVDDQLVATLQQPIPMNTTWTEIPFDLALLRGKRQIHVYLRVSRLIDPATDYFVVWGDADSPNQASVLNFADTDDLTVYEGVQPGEFLIRLALRQ